MSQMPLILPPDLVTAAVNRLADFPAFQSLVDAGYIGTDAADDALLADKLDTAWLFQGLDDNGRPFRAPEGSGTSAIVLSERREWAPANNHNTAYFPALQMLIYTDSSRNPDGSVRMQDADRKCRAIFRLLDRCFHRPQNMTEDREWPGLEVHSSLRGSPFSIGDVPGTQSMTVRGEATYNMIID